MKSILHFLICLVASAGLSNALPFGFWKAAGGGGGSVTTPDILHWPLNDASGTTIAAAVGSGSTTSTGTLNSDYLSMASGNTEFMSTSSVAWGSDVVSVCFWIRKPELSTLGTIFRSCYINAYPSFYYYQNGGTMVLGLLGTSGELTKSYYLPYAANTWTHIALVYDNSTATGAITAYVNGSALSLTTDASTKAGTGNITTDQFSVKSIFSATAVFDMDDLRIYSGQISAPDVMALYTAGRP